MVAYHMTFNPLSSSRGVQPMATGTAHILNRLGMIFHHPQCQSEGFDSRTCLDQGNLHAKLMILHKNPKATAGTTQGTWIKNENLS